MATNIQWTDETLNPFRARNRATGAKGHFCEKISQGCAHCYAAALNVQGFHGLGTGLDFLPANRDQVEAFFAEHVLQQPLKRRKPTRYFWFDMTDCFMDIYPDDWLDKCFAVMALTPQHTHQVLTKRPERMAAYINSCQERVDNQCFRLAEAGGKEQRWKAASKSNAWAPWLSVWPLPNVLLGFSAENQEWFDRRWEHMRPLAQASWKVFCSAEPLLSGIEICTCTPLGPPPSQCACELLSWLIIGGESTQGKQQARPCNVEWVRALVRQCQGANVPVFCKQLGSNAIQEAAPLPVPQDSFSIMRHGEYDPEPFRFQFRDKKGGNPEEWPEDLRVRQFPEVKA
jgi:protein gp37